MEFLLWIVALALIFWLLILRPAQRRQKEVAQVQASLSPGADVVLTSGIFGTLTAVDDATAEVEIAPGVSIKVARGAIASVARPEGSEDGSADDSVAPESNGEER